jgi:hypothetical protein
MSNRINGKSFDVRLMGIKIHFEKFTLNIEDNTTTAKTNGVPDGVLQGDVAASGELEIDTANFMLLSAAAKAAGNWRSLPVFPIDAYAAGSNSRSAELMHVRASGCKLTISDLLNIDKTSADKTMHKLKYEVTDSDFVRINGVPYLDSNELSFV